MHIECLLVCRDADSLHSGEILTNKLIIGTRECSTFIANNEGMVDPLQKPYFPYRVFFLLGGQFTYVAVVIIRVASNGK